VFLRFIVLFVKLSMFLADHTIGLAFGTQCHLFVVCYGHRDGCFCLIFARTAQQTVLDGTNGLSSSKPCAYCWIVWS